MALSGSGLLQNRVNCKLELKGWQFPCAARHDWTRAEICELFALSFPGTDLSRADCAPGELDLVEVQVPTLQRSFT
jgi:hypothetical protein